MANGFVDMSSISVKVSRRIRDDPVGDPGLSAQHRNTARPQHEKGKRGRKQYVRVNCIPIKENTVSGTLEFMRTALTWFDSEDDPVDPHWVWLHLLQKTQFDIPARSV